MDASESEMMMKPIGGYFEWEFPQLRDFELHDRSVLLNSGRHSLEYILRGLGHVKKLYIPYFTCEVVLQPLTRLQIPYSFYHIDENLEIANQIQLTDCEYILYTNYYGIKDVYVADLIKIYGDHLIIDNAQALYAPSYAQANQFYSPRKFMGMPDGGIAVTNFPSYAEDLPLDESWNRCSHLLKRHELIPSEGYMDFRENSKKVAETALRRMSELSKHILQSVDLDAIRSRRLANFNKLHESLGSDNRLSIPSVDSFACPLVYPYWTDDADLKKRLISNNIFVATYWPNVLEWCKAADVEYQLTSNTVCIPIDQRYNQEDMNGIIKIVQDR